MKPPDYFCSALHPPASVGIFRVAQQPAPQKAAGRDSHHRYRGDAEAVDR